MSVEWKASSIGPSKTFAEWGISNVRRTRVNQGGDMVTFEAPGQMDGDALFDYGETVTIMRDNTQWFKGRVISIPRYGTPSEETVTYEIAGMWWYLEKIVYQQAWRLYSGGALATVNKSRVILNQDSAGNSINSGAQITAAINYAISRGAPIALGTIDPAVNVPWEELTDITCAEVIIKMLRWSPDAVCYFDYSLGTPTLHVRARSFLDTRTLEFADSDNESLQITPRYDLQIPGLTLAYEQRTTVNGVTYDKITEDTAGNTAAFDSVYDTVEIAGSTTERLSQSIETDTWPADLTAAGVKASFWQARVKWLAAISVDDFTIHDVSRSGSHGYSYILKKGIKQDWMSGSEEEDTVTAQVDYTIKDGSGNIIEKIKNRVLKLTVISTNLLQGIYCRNTTYDVGETVPTGVAALLYASYGTLQYDGQYVFLDEDVSAARWPNELYPGCVLNITGGRTEWATMNAIIQQVIEDVDFGRTTVIFGPPKHLGADDLVTMLATFRNRKIPKRFASRTTGLAADAGGVELSGPGARNEAGDGKGETVNQLIRDATDTDKKLTLDPSAIGDAAGDKDMKPREILVYDSGDGKVYTRYVLCSDKYGAGSTPTAQPAITGASNGDLCRYNSTTGLWEPVTPTVVSGVVTYWEYNSGTNKIGIKTQDLTVIAATAQSGLIEPTGGTVVQETV